ncbi:hypothetical protein E4U42_004149 [Claviceps africana]|uniref:Uncharacterized protein n=1 Tax=Claviceps africana TaxID=83212 RepID=A0A8K0J7Z0_9HYPO|nr:hypothetical protein E4U42_004149 [Claviceps africana]
MRFSGSAVLAAMAFFAAEATAQRPSPPCNGGTMHGLFDKGPICSSNPGFTTYNCGSGTQVMFEKGGKDIHLHAPNTDSTIAVNCNGRIQYYYCLAGFEHTWPHPCPSVMSPVINTIYEDSTGTGD